LTKYPVVDILPAMKIAHELHEEKRHQFNRRGLIYQTPYANCPGIGLDKSSPYNEWIKKVIIFIVSGFILPGPIFLSA